MLKLVLREQQMQKSNRKQFSEKKAFILMEYFPYTIKNKYIKALALFFGTKSMSLFKNMSS